jgi:hypothetical protein
MTGDAGRDLLLGPTWDAWQHVAMTSWRDSASQQARDDLDEILNASFPFALQMLARHGEFFPYAVAISATGETGLVTGDPGDGERPLSTDVLRVLIEGLRADRDSLRATAVVSDVRLEDSNAIRVETEHREGQAFTTYLPYRRRRLRGIRYGKPIHGLGEAQIWERA